MNGIDNQAAMSTPGPRLSHQAGETDAEEEAVYRSFLLPSYGLSLCASIAALVSLVFTLWIFLRRRDATAGARGMVLLIVTGLFTAMSLTVLHVVNIEQLIAHAGNDTAADGADGGVRGSGHALKRFMEAQFVISNTSLLLRNWWVTFLTVVRFVVILFPLRVPEMLTRRRQLAAFFAILTGSAAFSIVRHLEEKTCTAHAIAAAAAAEAAEKSEAASGTSRYSQPTTVSNSSTASTSSCESFIIFFFVMQTGVPVPTVLVLSVALAAHLFAARELSDDASTAASPSAHSTAAMPSTAAQSVSIAAVSDATVCARSNSMESSCNNLIVPALTSERAQLHQGHKQRDSHQNHKPARSRGLCRKRKATRILLALAVTFTVLELPTFVYFILMHFFPHFRCSIPGKARLIFSGLNALVTLDTLANFFIFFVFSESFKREVKRCACRGILGRKRQEIRGGGVGGGGEGVTGEHSHAELRPLRSVALQNPRKSNNCNSFH